MRILNLVIYLWYFIISSGTPGYNINFSKLPVMPLLSYGHLVNSEDLIKISVEDSESVCFRNNVPVNP